MEANTEQVMNKNLIGIYPTDSVEYHHVQKIAGALEEMGVSVNIDTTMQCNTIKDNVFFYCFLSKIRHLKLLI